MTNEKTQAHLKDAARVTTFAEVLVKGDTVEAVTVLLMASALVIAANAKADRRENVLQGSQEFLRKMTEALVLMREEAESEQAGSVH